MSPVPARVRVTGWVQLMHGVLIVYWPVKVVPIPPSSQSSSPSNGMPHAPVVNERMELRWSCPGPDSVTEKFSVANRTAPVEPSVRVASVLYVPETKQGLPFAQGSVVAQGLVFAPA